MYPKVHSSIIYNNQDMKTTQVPINRWLAYTIVYINTIVYYSVIKKNEMLQFAATWMDLENIILSEVSQTEEDKYCMIYVCRI